MDSNSLLSLVIVMNLMIDLLANILANILDDLIRLRRFIGCSKVADGYYIFRVMVIHSDVFGALGKH